MQVDVLETVFKLTDDYSGRAKKAVEVTKDLARAQDQVTGVGTGDQAGGLPGYLKLATAELDSAIPGVQELVAVVKSLGIAAVGTGIAFAGLTGWSIKQYAEFEQLTIALRVYSGTAEETEYQLKRLAEVATMPGLGFAEAIQGSVRLQAIGMDARMAERALLAFGNALVSAGAGKQQLDAVILGLSQIVSRGAVTADNINQIANAMPQFRDVVKQIYGTADTEALQKMGISVQQFVTDVIDALEKMPKAAGGAQNSLDNFADTFDRLVVQFGKFSAQALLPALDALERFGGFLERENIMGGMVEQFYRATSATSAFANNLRDVAGIAVDVGELVSGAASETTALGAGIQSIVKELGDLVSKPIAFMAEAEDFGDFLVRGASMAVTTLGHIPGIFDAAMMILDERMDAIRSFVNEIIDIVNGVIGMLNQGFVLKLDIPPALKALFPALGLLTEMQMTAGGQGSIPTLGKVDESGDGGGRVATAGEQRLTDVISQLVEESRDLYNRSRGSEPDSLIAGDKSKGTIRGVAATAVEATEANTNAIERNTRIQEKVYDLNRQLQGGGTFAEQAVSDFAISKATGRGRGLPPELEQAMELLMTYVSRGTALAVKTGDRKLKAAGAI